MSGNNVWVGNLPKGITADVLKRIFAPCGDIISCKTMQTAKGLCGLVQFADGQSATRAVTTMNDLPVDGRPIIVQFARRDAGVSGASAGAVSPNLWVGNLPADFSEPHIRALFGQFGAVISCKLMRDKETMASRRAAVLSFSNEAEADSAIRGLNGCQLPGTGVALVVKYAHKGAPPQLGAGSSSGEQDGDIQAQLRYHYQLELLQQQRQQLQQRQNQQQQQASSSSSSSSSSSAPNYSDNNAIADLTSRLARLNPHHQSSSHQQQQVGHMGGGGGPEMSGANFYPSVSSSSSGSAGVLGMVGGGSYGDNGGGNPTGFGGGDGRFSGAAPLENFPSSSAGPAHGIGPTGVVASMPRPSSNLVVGNLPPDYTEAELSTIFGAIGPLETCCVFVEPSSGLNYGVVSYKVLQDAQTAVQILNGFTTNPSMPPLVVQALDAHT